MKIIPLFEEVAEIDEEVSSQEIVSAFRKTEEFKTLKNDLSKFMARYDDLFHDSMKPKFPDVQGNVLSEAYNEVFNSMVKTYLY